MKTRSLFNRKACNFSIENGDSADEAKILMYDEIWKYGVNAKDFSAALDSTSAKRIHLHINSPGGDVFEGMAIVNAIRAHGSRIWTHVDGVAASIASVIALAGDRVRMADNAFLMIHDPYTLAMGNAAEMRKTADVLDKVAGSIVNEYVKRTGKPESKIKQWMADETWFTAKEAKDEGFIDVVENASAAPMDAFDLSIYSKAPKPLLDREHGEPTVRDIEFALREAGFSRTEAQRAGAAAMAARSRTPRDEGTAALVAELQRTVSHFTS